MKGTVKWYDANKGFGFVIGEDGKEYHVNYKGIKTGHRRTVILKDETIEFELTEGKKGLEVTNACVVSDDAAAVDSSDT